MSQLYSSCSDFALSCDEDIDCYCIAYLGPPAIIRRVFHATLRLL